jgi:hypothetical protein
MIDQPKSLNRHFTQRAIRKVVNAGAMICITICAFVWHCHLVSAAQSVLAEHLEKAPASNAALSLEKLKRIDAFFNSEISAGKNTRRHRTDRAA